MTSLALALLVSASSGIGMARYLGDFPGGRAQPVAEIPRIATLGDSITEFGYDDLSYCGRAETLLWPAYTCDNHGVGGDEVEQMLTRWRDDIRGTGYRVLTFMGGINDVGRDSETAASTWSTAQTILDEARTDGMRVVIFTILPVGGSGWETNGRQTQIDAYNALLLAYCVAYPAVTCIDSYTDMEDPVTPDAMDPDFVQADKIHISHAGAARLAILLQEALD